MIDRHHKIQQVKFSDFSDWSEDYKTAVGKLIIACSQWEYLYELLWKDLNPDPEKTFLDIMRVADGQIKFVEKNLVKPLIDRGNTDMAGIIKDLEEKYRALRDKIVHGFHHILNDERVITRITARTDDAIAELLKPEIIVDAAKEINSQVKILNTLRRAKFHVDQGACEVSALDTTV